jgi:hypothetical protein
MPTKLRTGVGDPLAGGYFLEPNVRPDMVAQAHMVHHPSGEPLGVAPTRIALAARGNKDANGRPSDALFAVERDNKDANVLSILPAVLALFGPIEIPDWTTA